jgi:hypothetical protein
MYPVATSLHSSVWCPSLGERFYVCSHPECDKSLRLKDMFLFPVWESGETKVKFAVRAYCSLRHLTAYEPPHGIA